MVQGLRRIEVDEATAAAIEEKAALHGVSVAALLAEWLALDALAPRHSPDESAELEARWKNIEEGASTISQGKAERWLATWGTPGFQPWHRR